jgi:hypothetical protein
MLTYFRRAGVRLFTALLILATLVAALGPAFAQDGPPNPPLVPNEEPGPELAGDRAPLDERAAVEAALAAWLAQGAPTTPPEGALQALPEALGATIAQVNRIFLPLLRAGGPGDPGQGPPPITPTPITPTPEPAPPADVAVAIWPKPSIWVARGGLLEYEIRLANYGRGTAQRTQVTLPYHRNLFTVESSRLDSSKGDWVSALDPQSFTVTFGPLRPGERRNGVIVLRVNGALADGTRIDMRADVRHDDGANRSNWAPVLVGSGPSDAPYAWVAVDPTSGTIGTRYNFMSNRFIPGETVTTWLNMPGGSVSPLDLRGTANNDGSVWLSLTNNSLRPGVYQLVLYGNRSGITGVASFTVR